MTIRNLLFSSNANIEPQLDGEFSPSDMPSGAGYWTGVTSSADGSKIATCSGSGFVFTSSDSGKTWSKKINSPVELLTAIACSADGNKLVVQGFGGYVYTSGDFGETWIQRTDVVRYWHGVSSSADGTKLVAIVMQGGRDANGDQVDLIFKSVDSGATWAEHPTQITAKGGGSDICISEDGNKIMICEFYEGNRILISNDAGNTWSEKTSADKKRWYCMDCSVDGTKIIAGALNGYLYTSNNSGNTWRARPEWGYGEWSGVRLFNNDSAFLACMHNSSLIRYTNISWL